MRVLIYAILLSELFYGGCALLIGLSVGVQHGWDSGLRAFLYILFFFQFIIAWLNRKIIKAALFPEVKAKK